MSIIMSQAIKQGKMALRKMLVNIEGQKRNKANWAGQIRKIF